MNNWIDWLVFTAQIVALLLAFMACMSIRVAWAGQGIDVYQMGMHWKTYWPRNACKSLTETQLARYRDITKTTGLVVHEGWYDIVFWLWPIFTMRKFPLPASTAIIPASDVFTKGTKAVYRVELQAEPSITLRFISLRDLQQGSMGLPRNTDLLESCTIEIGENSHESNRLGEWIQTRIRRQFLDAFRQAAASFVWDDEGVTNDSENDIAGERKLLETLTLWLLATEESILGGSKVLKRPDGLNENSDTFLKELLQKKPSDFYGDLAIQADINLADMDLALEPETASTAQKAVNAPYVGRQTARANKELGTADADIIRLKGTSKADAAKALQTAINVDPATNAALQLLAEGKVKFVTLGSNITDALGNFGKK
ncbi:MAG: hypothetical protein ABIP54_03120 [Candidatus Andersenbacteria bacterium]